MSTPAGTLAPLPDFQCYDCAGCGDCCRGYFAIGVTPAERARIEAQGWGSDPALVGKVLFITQGGRDFTAFDEDGACVFLNENGLCRIHAKFGETAKPLACRLYPFRLIPAGDAVRVDVRFDCPAVAGNHGRPVTAHRAALASLLPQVLAGASPEPPALLARVSLPWTHLAKIVTAADRLLTAPLDVTRRVGALVNLSALLRNPRLAGIELKELTTLLDKVTPTLLEAAGKDALPRVTPPGVLRTAFRQLLGAYVRGDRRGEDANLGARFAANWRMLTGTGMVPRIRPDFPDVPFAALEASAGIPAGAAAEAFTRYLRVRLGSFGFCGAGFYGRGVLDGLDALLLTYPLMCWVARLYAAGAGESAITPAAAERAIALIDHQHGSNPVLDLPTERSRTRALCERTTLRCFVAWYGS
jgi:lysine-N-methylase